MLSDEGEQAVWGGDSVGVSWLVPNPHGTLILLLRSQKLMAEGAGPSPSLSAVPVFPEALSPSLPPPSPWPRCSPVPASGALEVSRGRGG